MQRNPAVFDTEETSTAATEALRILLVFTSQVFELTDDRCLSPFLHSPFPALPEPGTCTNDLPWLLQLHECKTPASTPMADPTTMRMLETNSSICILGCPQPKIHCHAHPWQDSIATEVHIDS